MNYNFQSFNIVNHLTGKTYHFTSMDQINPSEHFYDSIVKVCNEKKIYDWLFQESLCGNPYPRSKAENFKKWGTKGWKENTHFLFIVLSEFGDVAAACDIKSSDLDNAEIGYWSSSHHRGIITNAVSAMLNSGFKAGFKNFYAKVKKGNFDSAAVLTRTGFLKNVNNSDSEYDFYHLQCPK